MLTVDKFIDLINTYKVSLDQLKNENKDLKDIIINLKNVNLYQITSLGE